MASWDSIPEAERPFQRRLMEVFAGFAEHTDAQVGKLVDGLDQLGVRDNTIILYIWGDNGSSAEGQKGSISELLAQNNVPNTIEQQMEAMTQDRRTAGPGRAQGRQHVPRRLGVGGQHALPFHQARGRALRRHPQPDASSPGRRGSSRTGRRGRSSTTSTTSCRPSTK